MARVNHRQEREAWWHRAMDNYGINATDRFTLRRAEMTLSRWSEMECGDGNDYASWSIERDEVTNIPYKVIYPHNGGSRRYRVPDRETGALKRVSAILSKYPDLTFYHQGDPRGCALYIIRKEDVKGMDISSVYTRGICANY